MFLGKELGASSDDPFLLPRMGAFVSAPGEHRTLPPGFERVMTGAQDFRIALMCAEKEPLECHRTLLVSRAVEAAGVGRETHPRRRSPGDHADAMIRLIDVVGLTREDLFRTKEETLAEALASRRRRWRTWTRNWRPIDSTAALKREPPNEALHHRIYKEDAQKFFETLRNLARNALSTCGSTTSRNLPASPSATTSLTFSRSSLQHRVRPPAGHWRRPRRCSTSTERRAATGRPTKRNFLDLMRQRRIEETDFRGKSSMAAAFFAARTSPTNATGVSSRST